MQERNDEYTNIIYRILTFIFPLLYLSIKFCLTQSLRVYIQTCLSIICLLSLNINLVSLSGNAFILSSSL